MAMSSQFSLSLLELSKLVPFGSLVNATGHGLVRLLRQIETSGSDFITEQDLAEVFGRNRVEPLFASTFRTAVKQSLIHEISGIAELVIEGGAGPTVRRSLNEPGYFAMVVQLSLLTFVTHDLSGLTRSINKSLEQRAQAAAEYVAPPRYDNLMGALRAIREQTCGSMWELVISAVESKLYPSILWTDGTLYTRRTIPQNILQGLMDSFTAIQHLPENTRLRIRSCYGVPTIIVWAHHILGLTVHVDMDNNDDESISLGEGSPTVFISATTMSDSTNIALLNETDDLLFHVAEESQNITLGPIYRHPVKDYGTRILRLQNDDLERERAMVSAIVASCIGIVRQRSDARRSKSLFAGNESSLPSVQRIISVSRMVFASNADVIEALDPASKLLCAVLQLPEYSDYTWSSHYDRIMDTCEVLRHVIFVLSMAQGVVDELNLGINAHDNNIHQFPCPLLDARTAFTSLASLLVSSNARSASVYKVDDSTSVVSAWGRCLCLGSVTSHDPSDATAELSFIRGVPARGGEGKRYITDGVKSLRGEVNALRNTQDSFVNIAAQPGEKCSLESWTSPRKSRYFVGTTEFSFEVSKVIACAPRVLAPIGQLP
ncbi:MAG: hypothetical protein Q9203_006215 [Teloschistes exilis]